MSQRLFHVPCLNPSKSSLLTHHCWSQWHVQPGLCFAALQEHLRESDSEANLLQLTLDGCLILLPLCVQPHGSFPQSSSLQLAAAQQSHLATGGPSGRHNDRVWWAAMMRCWGGGWCQWPEAYSIRATGQGQQGRVACQWRGSA